MSLIHEIISKKVNNNTSHNKAPASFYDQAQLAVIRVDLDEVLFRLKCRAEEETWWQRWILRSKIKEQFTGFQRRQTDDLVIPDLTRRFEALKGLLEESNKFLCSFDQARNRNLNTTISLHLASDEKQSLSVSDTSSTISEKDEVLQERLNRLDAVINQEEQKVLSQEQGSRSSSMCSVSLRDNVLLNVSVREALACLYSFHEDGFGKDTNEYKSSLLAHVKAHARWNFFGPSEYQTIESLLNSADQQFDKIDYSAVERRIERLVKFKKPKDDLKKAYVNNLRNAFGVARTESLDNAICEETFKSMSAQSSLLLAVASNSQLVDSETTQSDGYVSLASTEDYVEKNSRKEMTDAPLERASWWAYCGSCFFGARKVQPAGFVAPMPRS